MARQLLHTRSISLQGFRRDDGLYELEARLTDLRGYAARSITGELLSPDAPLHDMTVNMVFDEGLTIHSFEAAMPATPYAGCVGAAPNFGRLAGLTIRAGFLREATHRVAGVNGCTHLRELLQQIATTAFQTVVGDRMRRGLFDDPDPTERPKQIGSCTGYRPDGDVVRVRWPRFHEPAGEASGHPEAPGQASRPAS